MGEAGLAGKRVVVPETRELDLLAQMLERHGAAVIRCPLVAISDSPDRASVEGWIRRFIENPPKDLILFTGEGLFRLLAASRRIALEPAFIAAIGKVRKITRGPKPAKRLREIGYAPDVAVEPPTTDGIIQTLSSEDFAGHRIGLQIYPEMPDDRLERFLAGKGAEVDAVLPYVYGSESDDRKVAETLDEMAAGKVNLITFTSSPQIRRLQEVARLSGREQAFAEALARTKIAAVGPVVAQAVEEAGGTVSIAPASNFHMKPMVTEILAAIG